jgi:DNA polymerase
MIGEAPGPDENKKGEVFIGRVGKALEKWLKPYEGTYYLTNAVKCFPPSEGGSSSFRAPSLSEIEYCKPFLNKELQSFEDTTIIMPLGNTALSALVGEHKGITRELGKVRTFSIGFKEFKLIPNYHPSFICRNPSFEAIFKDTIATVYKE